MGMGRGRQRWCGLLVMVIRVEDGSQCVLGFLGLLHNCSPSIGLGDASLQDSDDFTFLILHSFLFS